MFGPQTQPASWDEEKKYKPEKLKVIRYPSCYAVE